MPDVESNNPKSGAAKLATAKAGVAKSAATGKTAAKPAAETSGAPVTSSAPAGTGTRSGVDQENPLHKKLRLRPEDAGVVIAPPEDDDNPLLPLPKSFLVLSQSGDLAAQEGPFDYMHVFARDRADLVETFSLLRDKLRPGGSLWISWMKTSAKHGGGGQLGDLNENVIRRIGLTHGLVDLKVAALDRDWSALLLVHRKH
jgi:hypothetical protein